MPDFRSRVIAREGLQLPTGAVSGKVWTSDGSGIGSWVDAPGRPGYVTALPGSPVDAQEIYFIADATERVIWHLRYNAAGGTYKWERVGAADLESVVDTNQGTAATHSTYQDLATVGPSITIPLAGVYDFYAAMGVNGDPTSDTTALCALKIGAAATSDNDRMVQWQMDDVPSNMGGISAGKPIRRTVSAANTVCKLQYRSSGNVPINFEFRSLRAVPVRVG